MGLLDDAIREHLDLKRRRGADPAEIEQAEREALGPVRRGPEFPGEEVAPDDRVAQPEGEDRVEPPEQWEPFEEDVELQALEDHAAAPYPPAHGPEGDPLMEDEQLHEPGPAAPPPHPADLAPPAEPEGGVAPHPADPPPVPGERHLDQETEEYELEPADEDDVLESTPEFLQDTPDHDRLWFEQRPPRDFDFDG
jgi:hypothetical protein